MHFIYLLHLILGCFGFDGTSFFTEEGEDLSFAFMLSEGERLGNPEPAVDVLYRVTDSYRQEVGSNHIYTQSFPEIKGSQIEVTPTPSHLTTKGPNFLRDPFLDYRLHCLIHSSIPEEKNLDYSRWHQREGNHQLFRLKMGSENLWGGRRLAARIEAHANNLAYTSGDEPEWHSFEGSFTILKAVDGGKIFQGFNAMLNGWWAAVDIVQIGGMVNLKAKARRADEMLIAGGGGTLVGVPVHFLIRDNGYHFEIYANGRLQVSGDINRHPDDREEIMNEYGMETSWERLNTQDVENKFRWGIYMQSYEVSNDAIVMWSGIQIDGDSRHEPPICEWTSPGFLMPDRVGSLGHTFSVSFSFTLLSLNSQERANVLFLGELESKILAIWIIRNGESSSLRVEWDVNEMHCEVSQSISVGQERSILIDFGALFGTAVEVWIDGELGCTGSHPGFDFAGSTTDFPLYLSAPDVETADVCMTPIIFDSDLRGPDPHCCNGILSSGQTECCPAECGQCGGTGCGNAPGGYNQCCSGGVRSTEISCEDGPAPCVLREPPPSDSCADPNCCDGILSNSGDVCCPIECGVCGGSGCSDRALGSLCCSSGVRELNLSCDEAFAPCIPAQETDPNACPSTTTATPASQTTNEPTETPSPDPSLGPTYDPSTKPSSLPSLIPTSNPTTYPSSNPTMTPTGSPSFNPSKVPTSMPTLNPLRPSNCPSMRPTKEPTSLPTSHPTMADETTSPTSGPTFSPSDFPSFEPSKGPTSMPTYNPTMTPTSFPSLHPSNGPTFKPTSNPTTQDETASPTSGPTHSPSMNPSASPTIEPTSMPSMGPTSEPSVNPTKEPSMNPTKEPSMISTKEPSMNPTNEPSLAPTCNPSTTPSLRPTTRPTANPTLMPSMNPSAKVVASLKMHGDYNVLIPSAEKKALFLTECSAALGATCVDVRPGSIIVDVEGTSEQVQSAQTTVEESGLTLISFPPLVALSESPTVAPTIAPADGTDASSTALSGGDDDDNMMLYIIIGGGAIVLLACLAFVMHACSGDEKAGGKALPDEIQVIELMNTKRTPASVPMGGHRSSDSFDGPAVPTNLERETSTRPPDGLTEDTGGTSLREDGDELVVYGASGTPY